MDTADRTKKPSWTIMVYIAADSTLANFAVESLKQLNRAVSAPATGDTTDVVVAAQFSIDAPGGQKIKRYVFDGSVKENLKSYEKEPLNARNNPLMSERGALESFLKWVYDGTGPTKTDHYALILWSHGPELFLQPPLGGKTGDSASLYLTPGDLRNALLATNKLRDSQRKVEIVGFDACSMSMFEMAHELSDVAQLMIASQEEVPDASFPYAEVIQLFRQKGYELGTLLDGLELTRSTNAAELPMQTTVRIEAHAASLVGVRASLESGVRGYLGAYQDYIVGQHTGMNPVTLSVLNLAESYRLRDAVAGLACALLSANDQPELQRKLIQARKLSQDYAGGLYVDLHDFCRNLSKQLDDVYRNDWIELQTNIKNRCEDVQTVLKAPANSPTYPAASLILLNGAVTETGKPLINEENTTANHGVSIYLPYLTNRQFDDKVNRPLVKGGKGTNGGKGIPHTLNVAAGDYLLSALQNLVLTTESYYGDLKLAAETAWYSFITTMWTRAISQTDSDPGFRYSKRQIDINESARTSTQQNIERKCGTSAQPAAQGRA